MHYRRWQVHGDVTVSKYVRGRSKYELVSCGTCGAELQKRRDSLKEWMGDCRSCASKKLAERPEIKAIMRETGIKVMKRVGKLPTARPENRRYGPANNRWRGGITPELVRIRTSPESVAWRKAVFARDNYTCQMCAQWGGKLHADHIQPFSLHPDLRFEVDNGRTLCVDCHGKYGAKVSHGILRRAAILTCEAV